MTDKITNENRKDRLKKLENFILNETQGIMVNANDVFACACADSVRLNSHRIWEIIDIFDEYGHDGLVLIMVVARGYDAQQPLIDQMGEEKYYRIKKEVQRIHDKFALREIGFISQKTGKPALEWASGFGFCSGADMNQQSRDRILELEKENADLKQKKRVTK